MNYIHGTRFNCISHQEQLESSKSEITVLLKPVCLIKVQNCCFIPCAEITVVISDEIYTLILITLFKDNVGN